MIALYEHHPLAGAYPMLDGIEMQDLITDVREHGLLEPVVLLDGKVLDGRNRQHAAIAAGIALEVMEYVGDDPAGFVRSRNHHRRHLSVKEQTAALRRLGAIRNELEGGDPKATATPGKGRPSKSGHVPTYRPQAVIASEASASPKTVRRVDREAATLVATGAAATGAEAYGMAGRSRRARPNRGNLKSKYNNPAAEADKRYERLEQVIQRIRFDYENRELSENANWISRRLNEKSWQQQLRLDVLRAAADLIELADEIDAAYAKRAAGWLEGGAA